jgi:hydrogenase maturation protease
MSASAERRGHASVLIIGIGNPLRRDDGLGWAVAEALSRDSLARCEVLTVYQLTPELAEDISSASLVVMIDASHEGEPGTLAVRTLAEAAQPSAVGTHYTTPEELAALTTALYGHCPLVMVVSLTGADFGLGETCSALVEGQLPQVCAAVRQVCVG